MPTRREFVASLATVPVFMLAPPLDAAPPGPNDVAVYGSFDSVHWYDVSQPQNAHKAFRFWQAVRAVPGEAYMRVVRIEKCGLH